MSEYVISSIGVLFVLLGWLWGYAGYRTRKRTLVLDLCFAVASAATLVTCLSVILARTLGDVGGVLDFVSGLAASVVLVWFLVLVPGSRRMNQQRR